MGIVIHLTWYDYEDRDYDDGYCGMIDGEVSRYCSLTTCMRFSSKEEAEQWFMDNEDAICGDLRDYLDIDYITERIAKGNERRKVDRQRNAFSVHTYVNETKLETLNCLIPKVVKDKLDLIHQYKSEYSYAEIVTELLNRGLADTGY